MLEKARWYQKSFNHESHCICSQGPLRNILFLTSGWWTGQTALKKAWTHAGLKWINPCMIFFPCAPPSLSLSFSCTTYTPPPSPVPPCYTLLLLLLFPSSRQKIVVRPFLRPGSVLGRRRSEKKRGRSELEGYKNAMSLSHPRRRSRLIRGGGRPLFVPWPPPPPQDAVEEVGSEVVNHSAERETQNNDGGRNRQKGPKWAWGRRSLSQKTLRSPCSSGFATPPVVVAHCRSQAPSILQDRWVTSDIVLRFLHTVVWLKRYKSFFVPTLGGLSRRSNKLFHPSHWCACSEWGMHVWFFSRFCFFPFSILIEWREYW